MRGVFVTFEGVDGAGKSTQLRRAAERLRTAGRAVVETREPGGSPGAEAIRTLLVTGDAGRWSAVSELLLFTAARRDHLERTIEPALAAGAVVLCDRFVDSTRAYQAAGRGADPAMVEALHALAIGREADLTLVFDIAPDAAAARRPPPAGGAHDEDRYERLGLAFQATLRAAYRDIVAANPDRCRMIDAARAEDVVAADVDAALADALSGR